MRLETERLILRAWADRDRAVMSTILSDPDVRRFYPRVLTRQDAEAQVDAAITLQQRHGFHFGAVEQKSGGAFVGLVGLARISNELSAAIPTHPAVEIGWQIGKQFWGRGYAPEAARAWLEYAWSAAGLPEIVAFTYEGNLPSRRVMEKIGMKRNESADFQHPGIPEGHRLRPHVLYRITNPQPVRAPVLKESEQEL